jgi:amino acid permease
VAFSASVYLYLAFVFFDFNFFGVPVFVDCLKLGVENTARRGIAFLRTRSAPARYTKSGSHICHYAQSIISYFSINNDFTGAPLILSEFNDTILLISVYL